MKIICEKGYHAANVLRLAAEYLEKRYPAHTLCAEDMELTLTLRNSGGEINPENDRTIVFGAAELQLADHMAHHDEDYYNYDVLTRLYTRCKYEHDLKILALTEYECLTCIYMDAVGLHEINNHLGHEAGDRMLRCIADGIRAYFPDESAYRIGGDEFVLLCRTRTPDQIAESLAQLRQTLREMGYEVSVGVAESTDSHALTDAVNQAEKAMRYDKMYFYRENGGIRQMRALNCKLEKLLVEKQDANHFLNVIAPRYKGVYLVDPERDTCRYIYVPPYFKTLLEDNRNAFIPALRGYCRSLVRPEYYEAFEKLFDYGYVREKIAENGSLDMDYRKLDGNWVHLKVTMSEPAESGTQEMLWMFVDETK